ncbi:nitrate ABC transporter substrate-binding protein [Micromonospora sonchi]|uniref:Thiamine pyrimidine synthase n=1 Tax=Micromonospora sonchi TaxID=1763543 RepID=A0A917U3Q1_9ACTN|nr:ABC transporter substrate-binding protein [Micromonospora sonchi]GGM53188.1 nitrate ABC transporter substrate-binding protein [Micromonospora sonchi]
MRHNSRRFALVASVLAASMALTACGGSSDSSSAGTDGTKLKPFTFQLNFTAGGFNAGFEYAAVHGLYKEEGLDVEIIPGAGSGVTAQMVASGKAQIAFAEAPTTSALVAKGAPMKTIMTLYQSSPNQVTTLTSSGINSIQDLKGRSVGVPTGGSQTAMMPILLQKNGLKPSDINQVGLPKESLVQALLQKRVDAILGSTDSYGVQLEQQGAETRNWTFADYGVPTISTSVFANSEYLKSNADDVKAFIRASLKGWAAVAADPKAGAAAVKEYFPNSNEQQSLAELNAVIPLLCAGGATVVGKSPDESWTRTQDLLSSVDLLPAGTDATTYYSNDFLPAESEMQQCQDGKPVPLTAK